MLFDQSFRMPSWELPVHAQLPEEHRRELLCENRASRPAKTQKGLRGGVNR